LKRLYTFGCSFTRYHWPTWADIVGSEFDHYENWGLCGGGNLFILNSITECIVKNKLTKDDTVIVMWTNVTREDRYVKNTWITPGNIFTQDTYPEEFIKKYADVKGYFIRDLSIIHATKKMLESYDINYVFTSMMPITNSEQYYFLDQKDNFQELFDAYEDTLKTIKPSVFEIIFNFDWASRPIDHDMIAFKKFYNDIAGADWPKVEDFLNNNIEDTSEHIKEELSNDKWFLKIRKKLSKRGDAHPTPAEHLEFVKTVLPEFAVSLDTVEWVNRLDQVVVHHLSQGDNNITIDKNLWTKEISIPNRW
jgi:hypothetical protein